MAVPTTSTLARRESIHLGSCRRALAPKKRPTPPPESEPESEPKSAVLPSQSLANKNLGQQFSSDVLQITLSDPQILSSSDTPIVVGSSDPPNAESSKTAKDPSTGLRIVKTTTMRIPRNLKNYPKSNRTLRHRA
ncbi:hypothetical protein FRC07_012133 [Ceratobasidium sp. 392]|nr:hypothetical protein FRC07_012133 [Ceratobasidium sp. 392]